MIPDVGGNHDAGDDDDDNYNAPADDAPYDDDFGDEEEDDDACNVGGNSRGGNGRAGGPVVELAVMDMAGVEVVAAVGVVVGVVSRVGNPSPTIPTTFTSIHLPAFSDIRRQCVVCSKNGDPNIKKTSYCSARSLVSILM